jgi:hypothetical protein
MLAIGCAEADATEDTTGETEAAASAGIDFTASVGAVVVGGKRLCTAALVDVDAHAQIGGVSASGRQIVVGGACVGKLKNGFTGVAAFVTAKNGVSLATPIVSFDFQSQASAGLAVGILSNKPEDVKPMKLYGVSGTVTGGIGAATVLKADENGFLVGAAVSARLGVEFGLVTQCTEFHFKAAAGITVGAGFAANDDGLGAAAIVKVNGELRFAASIDAGCIVREIGEGFQTIAIGALDAANSVGDAFAQIGSGKFLAVYNQKERRATIKVKFYENAKALRVNAQGRVSASAKGVSCDALLGACELRPAGGFKKGETVDLSVDTHFNLFPNRPEGQRIFLSTSNSDPLPPPDPFQGGDH